MELVGRLSWLMSDGLRILFALNHQWEPDYKWLAYESCKLIRKPDRLVERTHAIFTQENDHTAVTLCLDLLEDILALAADDYNVALPRERLSEVRDPDHLPAPRGI
jgi:hypothetical protein